MRKQKQRAKLTKDQKKKAKVARRKYDAKYWSKPEKIKDNAGMRGRTEHAAVKSNQRGNYAALPFYIHCDVISLFMCICLHAVYYYDLNTLQNV